MLTRWFGLVGILRLANERAERAKRAKQTTQAIPKPTLCLTPVFSLAVKVDHEFYTILINFKWFSFFFHKDHLGRFPNLPDPDNYSIPFIWSTFRVFQLIPETCEAKLFFSFFFWMPFLFVIRSLLVRKSPC